MLYLYWTPIIAAILGVLSYRRSSLAWATGIDCSNTTTVEDLITCFDAYTVTEAFYSEESYAKAQPTEEQSSDWTGVIQSLLYVDGNCTAVTIPESISDFYATFVFSDQQTGMSYCVLHERNAVDGFYEKGWGLMVVPNNRSSVLRSIHLSAPHPAYDMNTPQQAAVLFASTGAKSLLITGRMRTALSNATTCITSRSTVYYVTDPTHDDKEPFVTASKEIFRWQAAQGGCPPSSCAFIQMHGKGASSCPTDTAFISSGLGNSPSDISWYEDNTGRPVQRLQQNLRQSSPTWNASLPSDSPNCDLTATTNVFGRFVNGIPESELCTRASNATLATGEFIHIEQAIIARRAEAYDAWVKALVATFPQAD